MVVIKCASSSSSSSSFSHIIKLSKLVIQLLLKEAHTFNKISKICMKWDTWNVQHAMCHLQYIIKPGLSLKLYTSILCRACLSWNTETEGASTIFWSRLVQSQIVHGKNEYWCTFKLDCGTRYDWVLQCLIGRLIGVMYSFASIASSLFLILNNIVRCWYLRFFSSEVHPCSLSHSVGLERFLWWLSTKHAPRLCTFSTWEIPCLMWGFHTEGAYSRRGLNKCIIAYNREIVGVYMEISS